MPGLMTKRRSFTELQAMLCVTRGGVKTTKEAEMAKTGSGKEESLEVRHIFTKRPTSNGQALDRNEIERRAYELYLARGGADGHAEEDWLQAERELQGGQP